MPGLDPIRLKPLLGPLAGRFDVDVLAECDSTNSEIQRRAEAGAPAGTVVVAERQTAGRGRRGRTWLAEPGDGLTFSLLWRFGGPPAWLSGLSLAVGVGVARALEDCGAAGVALKWPNDVLLRRGEGFAKLAGILVELVVDRRGIQAVIGIGLNLRPPAGDLPQPAAGLVEALPALPDRHGLLAALLAAQAEVLDRFAGQGFAGLQADWQARHAWQDRPVEVLQEGAAGIAGRCLGADRDGSLLLATAGGMRRILAGDVSLRPA